MVNRKASRINQRGEQKVLSPCPSPTKGEGTHIQWAGSMLSFKTGDSSGPPTPSAAQGYPYPATGRHRREFRLH
jgi:hypothetical protein